MSSIWLASAAASRSSCSASGHLGDMLPLSTIALPTWQPTHWRRHWSFASNNHARDAPATWAISLRRRGQSAAGGPGRAVAATLTPHPPPRALRQPQWRCARITRPITQSCDAYYRDLFDNASDWQHTESWLCVRLYRFTLHSKVQGINRRSGTTNNTKRLVISDRAGSS